MRTVLFSSVQVTSAVTKNGVDDTSSFAQTAIVNIESGFTPGIVGFGVGVVGDGSFKIGANKNAGNNMIPRETGFNDEGVLTKGAGDSYDHWARGGGSVKARFSNTTVRYGTQVLDLPVLASNTARLVPEYFTGTLLTSHEIKDLEVIAGKFTKDQYSDQVNTDGRHLDRAIVWGAKYKFDDNLNASYYGLDSKDKLERHYLNVNYKQPLANDSSLTYDFSGYHTKFDEGASTYSQTTDDLSNRKTIFGQFLQPIILVHITSWWLTNKTVVMSVMTMVKMLTAVKVFICQILICLISSVMMKNQHKSNIASISVS